jgi:hypothetical protein
MFYLSELGLERLTKVIALIWILFPIWDIPLQWEVSFQVHPNGALDSWKQLPGKGANFCGLPEKEECGGVSFASKWSCLPE